MRSAGLILAMLMAAPSVAEQPISMEPDVRADTPAAEAQGFTVVRLVDAFGTPQREDIDREIVAPVINALAPGSLYGFIFFTADIDGDGKEDVIVTPKLAGLAPAEHFSGAATFVYLHRDGKWQLALEGGAMAIGIRPRADGAVDIGLIQEDGVLAYGWNGERLSPL